MAAFLWFVSVVLVIAGIIQVIQGQMLFGILMIVLGFGVGPGGFSFFKHRHV